MGRCRRRRSRLWGEVPECVTLLVYPVIGILGKGNFVFGQHVQELAIGHVEQLSPFSPGNPLHAYPIQDGRTLTFLRERAIVFQDDAQQRLGKFLFKMDGVGHGENQSIVLGPTMRKGDIYPHMLTD